MDLTLKNKSVIVSGGASGIGEAIIRGFASEGAKVSFFDKNFSRSTDLVAELDKQGQMAHFIECDLTDTQICQSRVQEAIEKHGAIDVLVNNAGLNDGVGLADSVEDFRNSLERNLVHYFSLAHACRESLIATKGTIINISSKAGTTGQGGNSGYAASKGGINSLTREWALELAPHGIRVNCIIPAEVRTPQYESWLEGVDNPEDTLANITKLIPLGQRMTETDEIANTVLFLASGMSSHTTGQHVYVDGGYTHLDKANIELTDEQ
jgi:L-fucose dehydrogenase